MIKHDGSVEIPMATTPSFASAVIAGLKFNPATHTTYLIEEWVKDSWQGIGIDIEGMPYH